MNCKRIFVLTALALHATLLCHLAAATNAAAPDAAVTEARLLLDVYYGNRHTLQKAGEILAQALTKNPRNAEAYVQAARLTVMGGHIVNLEFRANTIETYHALLDQALTIDPNNQKAHILKAEAYDVQGDYNREKASLDQARTYGESDPWLWMGYGRYYAATGDNRSAYQFYTKVEALGPGESATQRKAYVSALAELANYTPRGTEPTARLRAMAGKAWKERHPADAWTLGSFAESFMCQNMFEDASIYAREAVRTMNYGAGRLTLAASLYAQAAQLRVDNKPRADSDKLITEAAALGFKRAAVLTKLQSCGADLQQLQSTLLEIVR